MQSNLAPRQLGTGRYRCRKVFGWQAVLALGLCVNALPGSRVTGTASPALRLNVSPLTSPSDTPLVIEVTHAPPGARVTLTVSSTDARGFHWRSSTVYRATKAGIVNPAENVAVSGSYKGLDAMGPIDYMSSPTANNEYCYCWAGKGADRFSFTAVVGHQQASVKVKRKFGEFAGPAPEELARQGFVGEYYSPLHPKSPGPAVLLFGGSEGGLGGGFMASELAADGYPTLDLAYFKEPGLPQLLYRIPLEYFAGALRWLARQPGVEKSRIWVVGASRGSEAALLLGVHYPSLVHGVVALVTSDASLCSYP